MKNIVFSLIALSLIFYGCKSDKPQSENTEQVKKEEVKETKITLNKLEGSTKYEEAKLSIESMEIGEVDSVSSVDFNFKVENYELGAQTPEAGKNGLANSGKGQHIHFILNNMPYSAHYESEFSRDIPKGNHVLLAFLSRSYHESVKNAFLVQNINVGNVEDEGADLSAPHLFYSRPKGTYKGKDTEKVLLDFFLVNTEISETGNKVKATINGEEFMISEWAPYVIEGLDKGEVSIRLQLLDKDNNPIDGPFNDVTRTITLQ